MRENGVTLIELLIVISIICILAAVAYPAIKGGFTAPNGAMSYGVNGAVEQRCINGMRFIIASGGRQVTQVMDTQGRGIACE